MEAIYPMNPIVGMAVIRVRDFTRINPLDFHGSKVGEDPQEFIVEIHKIVEIMFGGQGHSQFRKKFSSQGSSNVMTSNFNKDRVSNPMPQDGGGNGSSIPGCQKCNKSRSGKCLFSMDTCYGCEKSGHKVKYFWVQAGKSNDGAPHQNMFYALQTRHYHEDSLNIMMSHSDYPSYVYNINALNMDKNPVHHKKTKQIDMRHHFLRDNVDKENMSMQFCKTEDQIVEIFAKALYSISFEKNRLKSGMLKLDWADPARSNPFMTILREHVLLFSKKRHKVTPKLVPKFQKDTLTM
uniref:Gag-pol polyprotein n=1 Tax=Solanum tuberosum TaxID=4113 RepID=M1DII2_SOLTU